jgi:RHS repeat-associated protein
VPSYTNNSSNELTSTSAASFTYDNNGNTLTKTDTTGTRNYTWDFENRLASVVTPGTGGTATFKYDPFGRRIQKAFTQNSTIATTNYVYAGANVIEELDAGGNEVARYAQGPGVDQALAATRSGSTSYYQEDGLGSVTSLSNPTGALASTYTYDAFGNLTASTGSIINPFQYAGRDFDPETGLRYYRARYFDPTVGRFLSEDPIRFDGGTGFYKYVGNRPTDFSDPFGLFACPPNKSCGIAKDKAPQYDKRGSAPGGTVLNWSATFLNDATHDPKCCEVRQYISWNSNQFDTPPHNGFQEPDDQPNHQVEDRSPSGKRYGRRTGPHSGLAGPSNPGSQVFIDWYTPDGYIGRDAPGGGQPGDIWKFQLKVVDVCNGGKILFTSDEISIKF